MKRLPALLLLFLVTTGAGASPVLTVVNAATVARGSYTAVNVMASDSESGAAIGAYDLLFRFDSSVLQFVSLQYGSGLDPSGFGDLRSAVFTSPGVLEVSEVSLDLASDLVAAQSQRFLLFAIDFLTLSDGISPLNIELLAFSNQDGLATAGSVVASSIEVAPSAQPVSEPQGLAIFLSGSFLAIGLRRRKKAIPVVSGT